MHLDAVYLLEGVRKEAIYRFSYRVQNINGWSEMADPLQVRAAVAPSRPEPPQLVFATASEMQL